VTPDGVNTGNTITLSLGQAWIGDMASDGTYLYCCLVGPPNDIAKINLSDGSLVGTITGAWTVISQRGLAYDAVNDEFYIGGWNSNQIWRVDGSGATISTTAFTGVSGLAWHPQGGPDGTGSLWVAANTASSNVTEVDPNNGWATLQSFAMPGGTSYSSAGLALDPTGALWVPNQGNNTVYLVDLAEPLSGGGNWLTMDYYEGTVNPFGGVDNVPTHLDASGKNAGEVYTADIIFSSDPNVGTIDVPVTMIILGPALEPPDNLTATLTNDITGEVSLTWDWAGDSFQFFMIKRDGTIIGTTTNQYYTDILPDFGNYCYTVQAVYDEGQTAPAGPECVEWPNPSIFINPSNLEGWVWVDHQVKVYTTISNLGIGTLHYTFPDFATSDSPPAGTTINLPAGPTEAPQQTAVATGFKARPESTYTMGAGRGGRSGVNVLLAAADDGNNIINLLNAFGDLGSVDYYDARTGTPTLAQLQAYDVVVTWSNYTYSSAAGMGNVLASYVDAGGRVINLMFALDPSWGLQGTFISGGYSAMTGTGTNYSTGCLGNFDPTHPIMEGITDVCDYYRLASPVLTSGSTQIAEWSDGSIFVAVKDDKSVVSIGGYVGDSYQWTGQMPDLLHNAINWIAGGGYFIVSVNPATANVAAGGSQLVEITYDATGFDPGTYTQDLAGESNDPNHLEFTVGNTMHVYVPAQFAGMVVDNDDDSPLAGVMVTAGSFQTTTAEDGSYQMYVDEGTYDVMFQKLGYQTVIVSDTMAPMGVVTPVSVGMWDMNYPPAFVHAEVMDLDTWCQVTWALPAGPYEIIMDDGSAEDLVLWQARGSQNAVKFTPSGYPATVIGGNFYVGDGSYPGPFVGTEFGVIVYAADGANGMPGTMLDSTGVTVNNYGWVSVDWMNAQITEGDFYLAMYQLDNAPLAAPLGVDMTNPTYYKSYSKFQDNPWSLSVYQDFMIRAWVSGPEGDALTTNNSTPKFVYPPKTTQEEFNKIGLSQSGVLPQLHGGLESNAVRYAGVESSATRNVVNYRVARYSDFDPNASPETGTLTELATTGNLSYNDMAWAGLPMGWYAYGVKAKYTSGDWSDYAISNIVGHLMEYKVTVNVTLTTGLEPSNVAITMQGMEYPYETYTGVTPASGQVIFDPVWRGHYRFSAYKIGYYEYVIDNVFVNHDLTITVVLGEKRYPPTNLYVDPLSLEATWNEPLVTAMVQDFEGSEFPPAGWQKSSAGQGWFRTNNGASSGFPIPTWDSYYACDNDDAAGSDNVGNMDYLITPMLD
jgi:hypothetical protein